MLPIYIIIFLLIALCHGSADVYTTNPYIRDGARRIRLYHGINFVQKSFPWYPEMLLDSAYVANISQLGLNFVRLGMMWAGVEPQPKQYNMSYLNVMKEIVEKLEKNQIFVLLDMHQDALSSRVQSYDGIPAWLYDRFPAPEHPYPWPFNSTPTSLSNIYLTEACSHGFQCLYDNVANATDSMSDFWQLVASTFADYSNVIGYELINEPWAGNYLVNPTFLLPGIAGSTNLQPFYDKIARAIRSVDNKTLIFYQPVPWGIHANGKYWGSGFSHVPGDVDYRDRSVLSYHHYCFLLTIDPVSRNSTIPFFERIFCDDIEGPAVFRSISIDLDILGGSAFLTEFSRCDSSPLCDEEFQWGLNSADKYLQSWAFWGEVSLTSQASLARVYARAIGGPPIAMQYNATERSFYLYYNIDITINEPTEIFIPPRHFPQASYTVTLDGPLKWNVDPNNENVILVTRTEQSVQNGNPNQVGTVTIRPKI